MPDEDVKVIKVNLEQDPLEDPQIPAASRVPFGTSTDWFTIGDLHGNALKLLHFMLLNGAAKMGNDADYQAFVQAYNRKPDDWTAAQIAEFKALIDRIEISDKAHIRLIGDELCDRGQNDYFTLKLIQKLKSKATVETLLSNHGAEYVKCQESAKDKDGNRNYSAHGLGNNGRSSDRMGYLVENKLITQDEIDKLYNDSYKTTLKAISYELDTAGDIKNIYTHARMGEFEILDMAHAIRKYATIHAHLFVAGDLAKINAVLTQERADWKKNGVPSNHLKTMIDVINNTVSHNATNNTLNVMMQLGMEGPAYEANKKQINNGYDVDAQIYPFQKLMWNRECPQAASGRTKPITYINGHDTSQDPKHPCISLDNGLGRADQEPTVGNLNYRQTPSTLITPALTYKDVLQTITAGSGIIDPNSDKYFNELQTLAIADNDIASSIKKVYSYHTTHDPNSSAKLGSELNEMRDLKGKIDAIKPQSPAHDFLSKSLYARMTQLSDEKDIAEEQEKKAKLVSGLDGFGLNVKVDTHTVSLSSKMAAQADTSPIFRNQIDAVLNTKKTMESNLNTANITAYDSAVKALIATPASNLDANEITEVNALFQPVQESNKELLELIQKEAELVNLITNQKKPPNDKDVLAKIVEMDAIITAREARTKVDASFIAGFVVPQLPTYKGLTGLGLVTTPAPSSGIGGKPGAGAGVKFGGGVTVSGPARVVVPKTADADADPHREFRNNIGVMVKLLKLPPNEQNDALIAIYNATTGQKVKIGKDYVTVDAAMQNIVTTKVVGVAPPDKTIQDLISSQIDAYQSSKGKTSRVVDTYVELRSNKYNVGALSPVQQEILRRNEEKQWLSDNLPKEMIDELKGDDHIVGVLQMAEGSKNLEVEDSAGVKTTLKDVAKVYDNGKPPVFANNKEFMDSLNDKSIEMDCADGKFFIKGMLMKNPNGIDTVVFVKCKTDLKAKDLAAITTNPQYVNDADVADHQAKNSAPGQQKSFSAAVTMKLGEALVLANPSAKMKFIDKKESETLKATMK